MNAFYLVLGLLGIVYIVVPVDLLPEALLGPFGVIDDALVFPVAVLLILAGLGDKEAEEKADQYV